MSRVNPFLDKSIDETSYERSNRQIIYKFKSVYLSKKSKRRRNNYNDKPYFQTSGSLSEHQSQLFGQFFKNILQNKKEDKHQNIKIPFQNNNSPENQTNNFLVRF